MTIRAGDVMPKGSLGIMTATGPGQISTDDLFTGKRVVLFSVPGAFTPSCSQQHLPGFVAQAADLNRLGVDTIGCIAVNDVFVMAAWGKDQQVGDNVLMLADGSATYTKALGLDTDASAWGMGIRGRRFAIVVSDGTADHVAVDEAGSLEISSAEAIVEYLSTAST